MVAQEGMEGMSAEDITRWKEAGLEYDNMQKMLSTFRFLEKIKTGKFKIDYENIAEIQKSVDEGHQPWNLDSWHVAWTYRTSYGFYEEDMPKLEPISFSTTTGIAEYEIVHGNEAYMITLIQPVIGNGKIWTISGIELKE